MLRIAVTILFIFSVILLFAQEKLSFSHYSGKYDTAFSLKINGKFDQIYYTDDGSIPGKYSKRWKDSLVINNHTVLRIKPVFDKKIDDTIINLFFLIDFNKKLPVVSLLMDPEDLWSDEKGIYVRGAKSFQDSNGHYRNCNYHRRWEKEIHVMYIEDTIKIIDQSCGLKIFGESTRGYADKSLKLVARNKYGKKVFKHDFFMTKDLKKHKQLAIRTSGNDYKGSRFKDVLSAYLVRNIGIDYMAFQPVHLFVNAQYWGLYNLREKINEHYLRYNKGYHQDSVSIVMGKWILQQGSSDDYLEMYNWFASLREMDSVAYLKANDFLDMRNYINYRIFQLYINNADSRGNIRYWNSPQGDGKFRMILYDTDHGYGYYNRHFLENSLSKYRQFWYNPEWSTRYLRKLMQNMEFKREFIVQYAHLLNTSLNKDTIIAAVDYFERIYIDELPRPGEKIARHLRRIPLSEINWLKKVDELRKFAKLRERFVKKELVRIYESEGWFSLIINGLSGMISINDNYPLCLPYYGEYIKGYEFEICALDDGYFKFKCWSDGDTNRIKKVIATNDLELSINYIYDEPVLIQKKPDEISINNDLKENLTYQKILLWIGYLLVLTGVLVCVFLLIKRKLK